jgi:hypothetical protein
MDGQAGTPSASFFSCTDPHARRRLLERLEAEISELWGHLSAATARFLALVAEFDRSKAYERHGLVGTAQWLNWQCGIGPVAAREKVRVARALETLPQIAASFARGEISYSKVRAMTRVASPANEDVLLNVALHGTAAHVEKLVRKYAWTQRRDAARTAHGQQVSRYLSCFFYDDAGMLVIQGRLPPEVGALVRTALDAASDLLRERETSLPTDENVSAETWPVAEHERKGGTRRADALKLLAETFLANGTGDGAWSASAERYQVIVYVDEAILPAEPAAADDEPHRCELDAGPAVAVDTARRLCCDGTIVKLLETPAGEPLDLGRKTRTIPPALRRALQARDGGCRFPGCDRTRFTEGHHVRHWADGGETKLANLVTLCGFHHRLVHEAGFGIAVTDDGVLVLTRPDGSRIADAGTERDKCFRGNNSGRALESLNLSAGLAIDARTTRCRWLGECMDYSLAIEGMQWRDANAAARCAAPPAARCAAPAPS